jgi:hypothetical protein
LKQINLDVHAPALFLRWRTSGLINDRGVGAIRFVGYVFAKRSLFGFDPLSARKRM